jgi:Uma2 family endonuclease
MGQAAEKLMFTEEDFLAWDAGQTLKHEFIEGEVFAMAGAEDRHVTVSLNVAMALRQHLAGTPCRVFMADMKLHVAASKAYFYPDVLVTCSDTDRHSPQIKREAKLVLEVLSPGTAAYDRGGKFAHYRKLPSLLEYAVIDLDSRCCDVHRKGADGLWVLHPFAADDGMELASVGLRVPAEALFAEVDDPPPLA